MFSLDQDTICALATPSGTSGVAVIRLSGEHVINIARQVCTFLPSSPQSHHVYYGFAKNTQGHNLDEVLITYFQKGRSFTTESVVEISCHGSPVISQSIVSALVKAGARLAEAGEFTYRAFVNGRIDLSQAEAVLDLIESQSDLTARMALNQLQGHLSQVFVDLEEQISFCLSHLEGAIDFSEEDIICAAHNTILDRLQKCRLQILDILDTFDVSQKIKKGYSVLLLGPSNVGKSSLFNALLKQDKAIVTDQAGTTRDVLEGSLRLNGVDFIFFDSAGLRDTDDEVESLGLERSLKQIDQTDLVLVVFDGATPVENLELLEKVKHKNHAVVLNKSDKSDFAAAIYRKVLGDKPCHIVSAVTGEGLEGLKEFLSQQIGRLPENSVAITQVRHKEELSKVLTHIDAALKELRAEQSPEFVAFELHAALRGTYRLLGKEFDDQIVDRVFKEFCLGK